MKINKRNPLHWYYLALQAVYTFAVIVLRPFLSRGQEHIVVLYGHSFSGHLAALYDCWRSRSDTDLTFYFLTLQPTAVMAGADDRVNILLCRNFRNMLVVARSSAMITDHGLHVMKPLVWLTDIAFIDVGHGIPFKGYDEKNFRLRHHYREIWTSSEGLSQVYSDKCGCGHVVHSIGSPRTDKLLGSNATGGRFRRHFNLDPGDPVILYAPTWQQDDRQRALLPFDQSPEDFLSRISEFCQDRNCWFVFRSHQNAAFPEIPFERILFCSQSEFPNTEDILVATDILISDWSSIVFDFLVLDRPTIFLDVPHPFAKGCTLGPEYRFGRIVDDMGDLIHALGRYAVNPETYMKDYGDRHRAIKLFAYDNNADGRTSERCIERLRTLLA